MIDTHAHLTFRKFDHDREAVIERAFAAGNVAIIDVGIDPDSSRGALRIAEGHERIFFGAGIHPHDAERFPVSALDELVDLFVSEKVVAVGETGLDHYRDYAPHDLQESLFRAHIDLALRHRLPLIVHSRAAESRVVDILTEMGAKEVGGVLHCYAGDADVARRAAEIGFYFGFGGSVIRGKGRYRKLIPQLPRDRILLETDCPFLAPAPKSSRRNEPAFLAEILPVIASFIGLTESELHALTDANAASLFRLPSSVGSTARRPVAHEDQTPDGPPAGDTG